MPRRPAKVTQADIARAIRAAKEAGAHAVAVDNDGTIRIDLGLGSPVPPVPTVLDDSWTPSEALARHLKAAETS